MRLLSAQLYLSARGLLDRLIADDYRRAELTTLTLERKMGTLHRDKPQIFPPVLSRLPGTNSIRDSSHAV